MGTGSGPSVGEVTPDEAWRILREESAARLIDVRTRAEWGFVGVPDLEGTAHEAIFVEWARWPDMSVNPRFVAEVLDAVGEGNSGPFLFLCRSGARSLRAAAAVTEHLSQDGRSVVCLNVAEGFEGDLDARGHRGGLNGWKARGLAWRQS